MFVKIRICSPVGGFDDGAGPPILSVISRRAPLTRFTLIINIVIITIVVINIVIILLTNHHPFNRNKDDGSALCTLE